MSSLNIFDNIEKIKQALEEFERFKQKRRETTRNYYLNNKEKCNQNARDHYNRNKEKYLKIDKDNKKERYYNDPEYKQKHLLYMRQYRLKKKTEKLEKEKQLKENQEI